MWMLDGTLKVDFPSLSLAKLEASSRTPSN